MAYYARKPPQSKVVGKLADLALSCTGRRAITAVAGYPKKEGSVMEETVEGDAKLKFQDWMPICRSGGISGPFGRALECVTVQYRNSFVAPRSTGRHSRVASGTQNGVFSTSPGGMDKTILLIYFHRLFCYPQRPFSPGQRRGMSSRLFFLGLERVIADRIDVVRYETDSLISTSYFCAIISLHLSAHYVPYRTRYGSALAFPPTLTLSLAP